MADDTARVDLSLVRVIGMFRNERFVITLKGNFTYEGKLAKVSADGVKLQRKVKNCLAWNNRFVPWTDIESIRLAEPRKVSWWSYLLTHTLAGVGILLLLALGFVKS